MIKWPTAINQICSVGQCLLSQNYLVTIQINGWTMADYIGIGIIDRRCKDFACMERSPQTWPDNIWWVAK